MLRSKRSTWSYALELRNGDGGDLLEEGPGDFTTYDDAKEWADAHPPEPPARWEITSRETSPWWQFWKHLRR